MNRRIIHDLSANAGMNLEYYLGCADHVVAVETNPALCQAILERFRFQFNSDVLPLIGGVITISTQATEVDFYVHKNNSVLSQFLAPVDIEPLGFSCRLHVCDIAGWGVRVAA